MFRPVPPSPTATNRACQSFSWYTHGRSCGVDPAVLRGCWLSSSFFTIQVLMPVIMKFFAVVVLQGAETQPELESQG